MKSRKKHHQTFEDLKRTDETDAEFWLARDLQIVLYYDSWNKFKPVILKAAKTCINSNQPIEDHFSQAEKKVELGSWLKPHSKQGLKLIWILLFLMLLVIILII